MSFPENFISKSFSIGFRIPLLISLLLVMTKARYRNLPFKATEEDKEQIQEVKDLSASGCYSCRPLEGSPISQRAIILSALAAIRVCSCAQCELHMSRRASYVWLRFFRVLRSLGEMLGAAPAGSSCSTDTSSYGPCIFRWLLHPCLFHLLMEIHKLSTHPVIEDSVGGLVALSVTVVMI